MIFHSFLFVDVGNTRVKWETSAFSGKHPSLKGEMSTVEATPDRVRKLKHDYPGHFLVFASVVPKLTLEFSRTFKRGFHSVTADSPALGLKFAYPKPSELGADRLAGAVAAHETKKWPVIVVSCGTATAFTVLDAQGCLCGGAIAPGLHAQLTALLGATAQLPDITLKAPRSPIAKSTQEAIRAGVMLSFRGGVKEIIRQLSAALPGNKKAAIILTGGNAHHITDTLNLPHTLRPLLVFEGLRIIGNRVHPYQA